MIFSCLAILSETNLYCYSGLPPECLPRSCCPCPESSSFPSHPGAVWSLVRVGYLTLARHDRVGYLTLAPLDSFFILFAFVARVSADSYLLAPRWFMHWPLRCCYNISEAGSHTSDSSHARCIALSVWNIPFMCLDSKLFFVCCLVTVSAYGHFWFLGLRNVV